MLIIRRDFHDVVRRDPHDRRRARDRVMRIGRAEDDGTLSRAAAVVPARACREQRGEIRGRTAGYRRAEGVGGIAGAIGQPADHLLLDHRPDRTHLPHRRRLIESRDDQIGDDGSRKRRTDLMPHVRRMVQLNRVVDELANQRHPIRAATIIDANACTQFGRSVPIDDAAAGDAFDVIEERVNRLVRQRAHGRVVSENRFHHGGTEYTEKGPLCSLCLCGEMPSMRIKLLLLLAFAATSAAAQVTYIKTSSLIDGRSDAPRQNQIIVIRGNRIESVGAGTAIPDGAHVIDLTGMTVMPGLIDSHTHIFLQGEDPAEGGYDVQLLKYPLSYRAARAAVSAKRALDQGFTTIRDVETEGAGYGDIGIKQAIDEGRIPGPRIFASTRAISTTGGYNLEGYAPEITVPKGAQLIDGPVEARKAAREQLDHGADWIKVYMTHRSWLDKQGNLVSQPTLTVDELRAIVDEAHGWKRKVACHAYNGEGLRRALDGGCDSIEHGLELTDANIEQMLKQGTWYVPTLAVYYDHNSPL